MSLVIYIDLGSGRNHTAGGIYFINIFCSNQFTKLFYLFTISLRQPDCVNSLADHMPSNSCTGRRKQSAASVTVGLCCLRNSRTILQNPKEDKIQFQAPDLGGSSNCLYLNVVCKQFIQFYNIPFESSCLLYE